MEHLLGYARVSTIDQQPRLQVDALQDAGCYRVLTETASGARTDRPILAQVLDQLRPGDTLVVWKLDRLGRSLRRLVDVVTGLAERGVGFRSLQESIETTTPGGKLVFHVFAALAEFERDLIRERTTAGLVAARARGRNGGRPPVLDPGQVELARELYASRPTPRPRSPAGSRSAAAPSTATWSRSNRSDDRVVAGRHPDRADGSLRRPSRHYPYRPAPQGHAREPRPARPAPGRAPEPGGAGGQERGAGGRAGPSAAATLRAVHAGRGLFGRLHRRRHRGIGVRRLLRAAGRRDHPSTTASDPPTTGDQWAAAVVFLVMAAGFAVAGVMAARRQLREHPTPAQQPAEAG